MYKFFIVFYYYFAFLFFSNSCLWSICDAWELKAVTSMMPMATTNLENRSLTLRSISRTFTVTANTVVTSTFLTRITWFMLMPQKDIFKAEQIKKEKQNEMNRLFSSSPSSSLIFCFFLFFYWNESTLTHAHTHTHTDMDQWPFTETKINIIWWWTSKLTTSFKILTKIFFFLFISLIFFIS